MHQGGPPPPGGFGSPPQGSAPYGYPSPQPPPQPFGYQQPYTGGAPLQRGGYPMPYQPYGGTCPRCGSPHLVRPSFTWWGGLIGPKLLNHTDCGSCGLGFNAKTGTSNATAIGIYLGCGVVLGLMVVALRLAL